ncbi:growth arrest-specific protein 8-like [Stegastes partitus]|uniref:Dynein regulatory complex subunit 4 n=1 Tax=Stegastes partitus TaxID=144197 RepID=A0A9Y4JN99_9TELE|nr:PREDICTED: growth arrest-specific protein 8-like [Stegastes partitus]
MWSEQVSSVEPCCTLHHSSVSVLQLEEHIIRLREELDREREERSFFQLERDKTQALWDISKRNLEETKAELRNRHREKEEAEERHRVEITVYKQKLKHVLSEHHNTTTEQKLEGVASSSLVQNRHREAELGLRRDVHGLQAELREKKLHSENSIKELKLKHQVELMELNNEYDRRIREMEAKFHQQMQSLITVEEKRRRAEVAELDDQMKSRIAVLIENQDRAVRGAEEYYTSVQNKLLADQNLLKEELAEVQKRQARADKELSAAQQENRRLTEVLQEAEHKKQELQKRVQEHDEAEARRAVSRAQVKLMEKELRDLTVEHELLRQACHKVERERDELLSRQTQAVLDLQQSSGLKEMLLQRKLAALTQTLQKKEAQLCAALSVCSTEPQARTSAASRLEEVLQRQQASVQSLQQDLGQDCQEYEELLLTCTDRLKALGVPLHDFHFRPAEQIQNRTTPKP